MNAEATTAGDGVRVRALEEPISSAAVPESVLRYVTRTHEHVIIDDASVPNSFSTQRSTSVYQLNLRRKVNSGESPVVFIVDDDASMRRSIQDLLSSVALDSKAFATPQEFLDSKRSNCHGCMILDIRLPGMSGLDFQRELKEAGVTLPIIFITGHGDVPMSVQAMKSGAVEFLMKPFRPQELLDAVQHALDGDKKLREQRRETAEVRNRYETLTAREREVMELVASGTPQ